MWSRTRRCGAAAIPALRPRAGDLPRCADCREKADRRRQKENLRFCEQPIGRQCNRNDQCDVGGGGMKPAHYFSSEEFCFCHFSAVLYSGQTFSTSRQKRAEWFIWRKCISSWRMMQRRRRPRKQFALPARSGVRVRGLNLPVQSSRLFRIKRELRRGEPQAGPPKPLTSFCAGCYVKHHAYRKQTKRDVRHCPARVAAAFLWV